MTLRKILALSILLLGVAANRPRFADEWPDPYAYWAVKVFKSDGKEMTDNTWSHLHNGEGDADDVTLYVHIVHNMNTILSESDAETEAELQIRYGYVDPDTEAFVALSDWITEFPYTFVLENDDPDLPEAGGIYAITVEVQAEESVVGSCHCADGIYDFAPYPSFLHLGGRETESTKAPVIAQNDQETYVYQAFGTHHIPSSTAPPAAGYPAITELERWTAVPMYTATDLWHEILHPTNDQFVAQQMIWEEPEGTIDAGMKFFRAFPSKVGESYVNLWDAAGGVAADSHGFSGHRSFPVKDGPRGVGWTNAYIQGVYEDVAAEGEGNNFFFVNVSGQLRVMRPDGELITIVGWRVPPGEGAIWYLKPLNSIRAGMEWRGTISSGGTGNANDPLWRQPMDVAVDPTDPTILYVAGYYNHAIFKVVVDRDNWTGTVTLLAGSATQTSGFTDHATATSVRFNKPFSLVCDLACDYLYVSDQGNDAIRKVSTSDGATTTLKNSSTLSAALVGDTGVTCATDERHVCYPSSAVRDSADVTLEGEDWTTYLPGAIRIDSTGKLVLYDYGLGTLRSIEITGADTSEATLIADLTGDGGVVNSGISQWVRNWVWHDVDRWGAVSPQDSVFWVQAVGGGEPFPEGEGSGRFNEDVRWFKIDGSDSAWVFPSPAEARPVGVGPLPGTRSTHYPWLVAVDPNGALITAGFGSHGISRIRKRHATDPDHTATSADISSLRVLDWIYTYAGGTRGYFYTNYTNRTEIATGASLSLYHGWYGHNIIGLPDAWAIGPNSTNEDIDAFFAFPTFVTEDAQTLTIIRNWLKFNRGHEENFEGEEPGPEAPAATIRVPFRVRDPLPEPLLFWGAIVIATVIARRRSA